MSAIKDLLTWSVKNHVNLMIATDLDLFNLFDKYGLKVKKVNGMEDDVEDIIFSSSKDDTLVVFDADSQNNINWNKLLISARYRGIHLIQWKTIKDHDEIKLSAEASKILTALIYIREEQVCND